MVTALTKFKMHLNDAPGDRGDGPFDVQLENVRKVAEPGNHALYDGACWPISHRWQATLEARRVGEEWIYVWSGR